MTALHQHSTPTRADELEFGRNDTPATVGSVSNERYLWAYVVLPVMEIGCQQCQCWAFPGRTSNDVGAQGFATKHPALRSMHSFFLVITRGNIVPDIPRRGLLIRYVRHGTEPTHLKVW